ncbi:hypothetical protein QCA50_004072 [Cerrena zonata]|uniref:Vomeronasal type-1 receptor n=1 Tax=Cerrena zonata TaxID=2478898 RepID=A0AAW0GKI0_9APHY
MEAFTGRGLTVHDAVYILSRLSSGGLLMAALGFLSKTGSGCQPVPGPITDIQLLPISLPCIGCLLTFKTDQNGLWSTTLLSLSIPFSSGLNHVTVCNISDVRPIEATGFIAVELFDTVVFVAVSIQVVRSSIAVSRHDRLATFVTGSQLGHVSKVLLQTGQLYYLTTVGVNLLALCALLSSESWFSPMFKAGMTLLSIALQNILTCKAVRLLSLGVIPDDPTEISHSMCGTLRFATTSLIHQNNSTLSSTYDV